MNRRIGGHGHGMLSNNVNHVWENAASFIFAFLAKTAWHWCLCPHGVTVNHTMTLSTPSDRTSEVPDWHCLRPCILGYAVSWLSSSRTTLSWFQKVILKLAPRN